MFHSSSFFRQPYFLAILLGISTCAMAAEDYILIEMENFTEARTESDDFAKTGSDLLASGRKILFRVFNPGTLHYDFTVPEDGIYTAWIRLARRNDGTARYELDGGGFKKVTTPKTYINDREQWAWQEFFKSKLSKGPHQLTLANATWRIDCIVLSAKPGFTPPEIFALNEPSEEDLKIINTPLIPIVPEFLENLPEYELPEWFDGHRVQLHTRLGLRTLRRGDGIFLNAGKLFKEMGATVYSRHIVSGGEGAWWPSAVGAVEEIAKERNIAREIIDESHRNGTRVIAYYRHIEDDWAAKNHPEWCCVDPNGKPIPGTRGINMCMNSPYADYVQKRQLELIDLGVDGFFYDSVHMPRSGCWCDNCKREFKKLTDLEYPERPDPLDPRWHKLKEFNNYTIAKTFYKWRQALHARKPDVVMVVGSNLWPCLSDKHMDHRAFRIIDCHKIEYNKGMVYRSPGALWAFPSDMRPMSDDVRLGMGYDVARDATDGRPAHVWAHRIRYESHALAATAGLVAHGCIANLDVQESNIPDMNFKTSFEMGDKVSPYLAGTRPLRWIAILHSEYARDRQGLDNYGVWERLLYPIYGVYHTLLRDHMPVGFILDSQLEQECFTNINVIFVPDYEHLTPRMKTALANFKKQGGAVIKNQADWEWHTEAGWPQAVEGFKAALAKACPSVPVSAKGGNEKMHLQAYWSKDKKRLTVCMANDFTWIQVGGKGEEGYVEGDNAESVKEKPAPCTGVVMTLDTAAIGNPKKVLDVLQGQELPITKDGSLLRVEVPDFEYLATLAIEF